MKLDRIVIGIDFGLASDDTARWIARRFAPNADLVLVHAIDLPRTPAFLEGRFPARASLLEVSRTGADDRLRSLQQALSEGREGTIRTEIRLGRAFEELVAAGMDTGADLIAVGEHGQRPGVWRILGSTAERLIAAANIPILLTRGAHDETPKRILVPMDDSEPALLALAWARLLEQKLAARATVFHALHPILFGCVRLVSSPEKAQHVEKEVEQAAREWFAERVRQAGFTEDTPIEITYGEPRYEILAAARRLESDLIVMGNRGTGAINGHLLGSVVIALLRGASCPVLVVPSGTGP